MKQAQNLHPTSPKPLDKPFSKFFSKHPSLRKFAIGSLIVAGLAGFGFAAKDALAKPPPEWKQPIARFDPTSPEYNHGPDAQLFKRYQDNPIKPISEVLTTTTNGFTAESFQDDAFRVTIVKKDGQLQAVYMLVYNSADRAAGFFGVARDPSRQGHLMSQLLGASEEPIQPGCALQPDGSPIFVSKTTMFVVDWKDDGHATTFNILPRNLATGITELDPRKLQSGYFTDDKLGSCLVIHGSELAGAFVIPQDPKQISNSGFLPNSSKDYSEIISSLQPEPSFSYKN